MLKWQIVELGDTSEQGYIVERNFKTREEALAKAAKLSNKFEYSMFRVEEYEGRNRKGFRKEDIKVVDAFILAGKCCVEMHRIDCSLINPSDTLNKLLKKYGRKDKSELAFWRAFSS